MPSFNYTPKYLKWLYRIKNCQPPFVDSRPIDVTSSRSNRWLGESTLHIEKFYPLILPHVPPINASNKRIAHLIGTSLEISISQTRSFSKRGWSFSQIAAYNIMSSVPVLHEVKSSCVHYTKDWSSERFLFPCMHTLSRLLLIILLLVWALCGHSDFYVLFPVLMNADQNVNCKLLK